MKRIAILVLLVSIAAGALSKTLASARDFDGHQINLEKSGDLYKMVWIDSGSIKAVRFNKGDMEAFRYCYEEAKRKVSALSNGEMGEVSGPLKIDECLFEFGGSYPKDGSSKWLVLMMEDPYANRWEFYIPISWWGDDREKHRKAKADFDSLVRKARF